jgi:hypothetical protein
MSCDDVDILEVREGKEGDPEPPRDNVTPFRRKPPA